MMRGKIEKYVSVFIAASVLLVGGSFGIYLAVVKTRIPVPNALVQSVVVLFLGFLGTLVLRYFCLLWFSYLQHLEESQISREPYTPFVSIMVPAYNEGIMIDASLGSLLEQNYPNYEVIVIDDGSTDDTYARAKVWEGDYGNRRVRVFTKPNQGKAEALNYGIVRAEGQIIACIDSDSKLEPDAIRLAARHFRDARIAAVAGNVKVSNRDNLYAKLQALEYIQGLNLVRKAQAYFRSVNIVPGPLGLFRRDVVVDVGLYDSDTFAEDCDLTLKILEQGWHITYEPGSIAWTEAPEALLDLVKQRYRWTRGILQSIKKHKKIFTRVEKGDFTVPFTAAYMAFEGILWPVMNIAANFFLIYIGAVHGLSHLLVLWWVQLTLLDIAAALHCMVMENEDLRLVGYAVLYRVFFILVIDFYKVYGLVEETLGLKMGWGKLDRLGRI